MKPKLFPVESVEGITHAAKALAHASVERGEPLQVNFEQPGYPIYVVVAGDIEDERFRQFLRDVLDGKSVPTRGN